MTCKRCGEFKAWCRCVRQAIATFLGLTLIYGCAALGGQHSPMGEYLMGVEDAVLENQMAYPHVGPPPIIVVDFETLDQGLGKCSVIEGDKYIYVYIAAIMKQAKSVREGRLLIAEVLSHELGHAALTCSDADHEVLQ